MPRRSVQASSRRRTGLVSLLFAAALGPTAGPAAGQDRLPVELSNPAPRMPVEAAGAGIEPEVTVELAIDDRGRVETVEVLKIVPSSPWDALFADAMKTTLSGWRYAPRHENGKPVPTRLQWTMRFSNLSDKSSGTTDRSWWEALLPLGPGRQPASLLGIPHAQRVELLEANLALGVQLLGGESAITHQSPRFTVRTDSSRDNAEVIAQNFEAAYGALGEMIGPAVPIQPESLKTQVLVFRQRDAFTRYMHSSRPSESVLDGFYSQLGVISFHLELGAPRQALEMILHEATHAYMDRHLLRPGVQVPHWLAEGMAEYLANSKVEKGRLLPGRTPRRLKQYLWFREGSLQVMRDKSGAATALEEIRRAARRGEALTLAEMLDADRDRFYGERLRLYYGMSWLLVHFLRHGRDEWTAQAFPEFLLYVSEGYPISASLEHAYATSPAALEPEFRAYLASF